MPAFYAGKSQAKSDDVKSENKKFVEPTPITTQKEDSSSSKEAAQPESQPLSSSQTDVSKSKKAQSKDSSAAQGLAALKSLIAKAAAGTLTSKSSTVKSSSGSKIYDSVEKSTKPSGEEIGKIQIESKPITVSLEKKTTSTSTAVGPNETRLDSPVQENDYWLEEKLKMQKAPTYQSFQKGVQLKKNLTSKGTSPPPQTISTQV